MANQVLFGFHNLEDVYERRLTEVGVDVVSNAVDQAIAEHNRQISALTALFVRNTDKFKQKYNIPTVARLQGLTDDGRPTAIRPTGQIELAWPIKHAGIAWGANHKSRVKMTVAEAAEITSTLLMADMRWMRDNILASLYTNVNWTFDDPEHGNLTIKPIANNDTDKYYLLKGADQGAVDNHFEAQANDIGDGADNPFDDIYDDLLEHPENSGEVISFIPTNQKSNVEGMTNFKAIGDPNITEGISSDRLTGQLGVAVPGEVIGYVDKCWIVEWRSLPDDYVISVTTDGEKPLAMRQETEGELQGFYKVAERNDHPFYQSLYERRAGFGAWNRTGARVDYVGNSGTYAIPTGYTASSME